MDISTSRTRAALFHLSFLHLSNAINQLINQLKRKTSYANGQTNLGHKAQATARLCMGMLCAAPVSLFNLPNRSQWLFTASQNMIISSAVTVPQGKLESFPQDSDYYYSASSASVRAKWTADARFGSALSCDADTASYAVIDPVAYAAYGTFAVGLWVKLPPGGLEGGAAKKFQYVYSHGAAGTTGTVLKPDQVRGEEGGVQGRLGRETGGEGGGGEEGEKRWGGGGKKRGGRGGEGGGERKGRGEGLGG